MADDRDSKPDNVVRLGRTVQLGDLEDLEVAFGPLNLSDALDQVIRPVSDRRRVGLAAAFARASLAAPPRTRRPLSGFGELDCDLTDDEIQGAAFDALEPAHGVAHFTTCDRCQRMTRYDQAPEGVRRLVLCVRCRG